MLPAASCLGLNHDGNEPDDWWYESDEHRLKNVIPAMHLTVNEDECDLLCWMLFCV